VSRVDRARPDRGGIVAGDVIETANGQGVPTPEDWRVRVARLAVGEELALRVRRGGELRDVRLQASAQAPADGQAPALGLQLRSRPGAGTEILEVAPGSAGARSGLRTGDVITSIAGTTAPSPVQVRRAFSTVANGAAVLVAVTRGAEHHVTALVR
jgi:serine protease DegQ